MNTRSDYADHDRVAAAPVAVVTPSPVLDVAQDSAVSWGAIVAGAMAAAAMSLILLILGLGLGLSSVSPWSFEGVSAETFGWSSIAWLTFTAIAASALGGYIAGRMRTRWVGIHGDETYFRDTAHGFVAWAVATLLTAGLLTSAIGGILGAGAKVAGATAGAAVTATGAAAATSAASSVTESQHGDLQYWVDSLFRAPAAAEPAPTTPTMPASPGADTASSPVRVQAPAERDAVRAEVNRIVLNSLGKDAMDPADTRYLGQLVATQTGMTPADAQARVSDVQTRLRASLNQAKEQAKQTADDARKATAYAALWLFITLLIGAFVASLSATWGGRRRDL
ncbi:hypothetical protein [Stenotrophomonas sp. YIM B06876]|uniref:hypothetical protein n=1 Tax=Stenotrophomonas sp. YIM B06876 TaxID=3060211 RepID=UPI00273A24B4|nr:hypothetical protein [Stenotrophomonas sp. YIM B06876]